MMDNSFQYIPGSAHETTAPVDSSYEQSCLLPSVGTATSKFIPEDSSATSSARPSRESSPVNCIKTNLKITDTAHSSGPSPSAHSNTSRENSSQEPSFTRNKIPSSAITPITSSAPLDSTPKSFTNQRLLVNSEVKEPTRLLKSTRLRTPAPATHHNLHSTRNIDIESVSKSSKTLNITNDEEQASVDSDPEESSSFVGMRTPARGVSGTSSTLETVQELSQPNTPISCSQKDSEKSMDTMVKSAADQESQDENRSPRTIRPNTLSANESNNEAFWKADTKIRVTGTSISGATRSGGTPSKSFLLVGIGRGKPSSEGSSQNMTVETETVSSISQIAVGPTGLGNNGSIRTKPSSETIRPKKEKKKVIRKPPSLTSGTASSKADIFEAKVASAVDEATSSDSEETFVYESNPPESNERPRRFQSRTPSTTSMVSQADQRSGVRSILDSNKIVVMKKSMKFTNSYSSTGQDTVDGDQIMKGTIRSNTGAGKGTTKYHHVNSRWGRHAGNSHHSLFDDESAFSSKKNSRLLETNYRLQSRPTSPKTSNKMMVNSGKSSFPRASRYNPDCTSGERTPLLRTLRPGKSVYSQGRNESFTQSEHQNNRPFLSRCRGCLIFCLMMLILIIGGFGLIYATTQPLLDVEILALNDLYVSEEVLVFDIKVKAKNPNLVAVTIESTDLIVIAQSNLSVIPEGSRKAQLGQEFYRSLEIKKYTVTVPLVDDISQRITNLEIGHVFSLDIPLNIEGSPFRSMSSTAVGQISVINPGHNSIPNGSDCWKKIIRHNFILILRGRLNYSLPFSQKKKSASVDFQVLVTP